MSFLGMDVEQTDEQAAATRVAQQRIESILQRLSAQVAMSAQHWTGPDAEDFRARWIATGESPGQGLVSDLGRSADELTRHVQEQDQASEPGEAGSLPGGNRTPGGRLRAGDKRYGGGHAGKVSPEVTRAWDKMPPEDKQKVLQEVANQELERYGHDGLPVHFDKNTGYDGYWTEWSLGPPPRGEHIVIDAKHANDADALNTVAHEARHAAQDQWVEETDPTGFWFWRDEKEDEYAAIQEEHGVTRTDIEAFRENDREYFEAPEHPPVNASPEEQRKFNADYEKYRTQPLEKDAWDQGDRFAEELTVEQLQQYQRDAGVSVTAP